MNQLLITSMRATYAVGIDADIDKSGLAVYSRTKKALTYCSSVGPHILIKQLLQIEPGSALFFIDAGWKNGGYFHYANFPENFNTWSVNAQRAYLVKRGIDVGRNFGVGQFLVSVLTAIHGPDNVREIQPVGQKNSKLKWDAAKLKQITGWQGRTNQDSRDAARLCWARI